jgi:hypothetical protein
MIGGLSSPPERGIFRETTHSSWFRNILGAVGVSILLLGLILSLAIGSQEATVDSEATDALWEQVQADRRTNGRKEFSRHPALKEHTERVGASVAHRVQQGQDETYSVNHIPFVIQGEFRPHHLYRGIKPQGGGLKAEDYFLK